LTCLADESVDRAIVDALREGGHEVEYVADLWPGISDPEVLERAQASGSVLPTGDKDFGELVFRRGAGSGGVVLFRLPGLAQQDKARFAVQAFRRYGAQFKGAFTVVERARVRIRKH
jgi:predicted nuclease of predicted toxin-antitoxin system